MAVQRGEGYVSHVGGRGSARKKAYLRSGIGVGRVICGVEETAVRCALQRQNETPKESIHVCIYKDGARDLIRLHEHSAVDRIDYQSFTAGNNIGSIDILERREN